MLRMREAHQESMAASASVLKSPPLLSWESDCGQPSLWHIVERNSLSNIEQVIIYFL